MKQNEILQTEQAISFTKEQFSKSLSVNLNLHQISAPIMVPAASGINDDLNGTERAISFPVKILNDNRAVIVHSLAKWKRIRIAELNLNTYEGVLTDMKALRPDEDSSPVHSIYVDQWDWELKIEQSNRCISYLKNIVRQIYKSLLETEEALHIQYGIEKKLQPTLSFIQSEELLQLYPDLTPKEREDRITKEYGAIFIIGIGKELSNGEKHDNRSSDYDDWSSPTEEGYFGLNGDLLVWNHTLDRSLELSSMGIRVDKEALQKQLAHRGEESKLKLHFHQLLLNDQLPLTIGGGLGQSRICMQLLHKRHIGEVQASLWPTDVIEDAKKQGIHLL